jgi:hypothetical protein
LEKRAERPFFQDESDNEQSKGGFYKRRFLRPMLHSFYLAYPSALEEAL